MRRVLPLIIPLFIFGNLSAQETIKKPVIIETLPARPAIVKVWEPIAVSLRIRFLDGGDVGKEVKILESEIDLESINFGKFEADEDFEIEKRPVGRGHVWYLNLTLRRIGSHEGQSILQDTVPSISIPYIVRETGRRSEETKIQFAKTRPLVIRYVLTITNETNLDVRDEIDLGQFRLMAYFFWTLAFLLIIVPLLFFLKDLKRGRKARLVVKVKEKKTGAEEDHRERLSPKAARRKILNTLRSIQKNVLKSPEILQDEAGLLGIEEKIRNDLRNLFLAEMPDVPWGTTPPNMKKYIASLEPTRKRELLISLSYLFHAYQDDLDIGKPETMAKMRDSSDSLKSYFKNVRRLVRGLYFASYVEKWRKLTSFFRGTKRRFVQIKRYVKEKIEGLKRPKNNR